MTGQLSSIIQYLDFKVLERLTSGMSVGEVEMK